MHRCGFAAGRGAGRYQRLMSHFARADEPSAGFTAQQIARFDQATAGLPGLRSLANSAGVLCWPQRTP